jgi:hypothetical protein
MCRDWLFVLSDCGRMTGHSEVTRSISEQGALFRINVENRDYHYLSQSEIAGAKRISRHLFGSVALEAQVLTVIAAVLGFGLFQDGNVGSASFKSARKSS